MATSSRFDPSIDEPETGKQWATWALHKVRGSIMLFTFVVGVVGLVGSMLWQSGEWPALIGILSIYATGFGLLGHLTAKALNSLSS